ncbi:hypothetical protein PoB_005730200 [Plakobranchus ocellatus]|uniref:Uncharacterized protein n=1 Tax=Plakobranchus ocellatus TaxID=259542 RepID=A0AAV4CHL9_9GAST|nr:hypothetical protein PoB_005730200 [Plakobranchus ocellatus]
MSTFWDTEERREKKNLRNAEKRKEIELVKLRVQAAGIEAVSEANSTDGTDAQAKLPKCPNFVDKKVELSDTKETYVDLRVLFEREHFMDVCPVDMAVIMMEKVLCEQASVGKEADLYVLAR